MQWESLICFNNKYILFYAIIPQPTLDLLVRYLVQRIHGIHSLHELESLRRVGVTIIG